MTVAALYVQNGGCYWNLPHVDAWDQKRDARLYDGPWPVVAYPPCERWGRYHMGSPWAISRGFPRKIKGDDNGCFEAALASVRKWGGVLEHPEGSAAWDAFGLRRPDRDGKWIPADWPEYEGWTCCVEQGAWGHKARKATWLYACGVELPTMPWGRAQGDFDPPYHKYPNTPEGRSKAQKCGTIGHMRRAARAATPKAFRDLLISMAETANKAKAA